MLKTEGARSARAPEGGPLVNITKLRPPSNEENGDNGRNSKDTPPKPTENGMRFLRYQMQAVARHMLPNNRVRICLRWQKEKFGTVDVFKHRQTQKVFYAGLMVCGSVWNCPVCAAKISERRRMELRRAFDQHLEQGGFCSMVTLTFSHSQWDKLKTNLDKLAKAMEIFRRGKKSDKLRKEIGEIGAIRALEVTYGSNGWHPHIHLLIMHTVEIEGFERQWYREKYYELWESACEKVGLETSFGHGLKLDDAAEADQYIGKWGDVMKSNWGPDREMTKANSKKGREGSLTPFDFLRIGAEEGDLEYEPQFREYAAAMKSKTQLKWSPGLKYRFDLEEKTDEEIVLEKEDPADLLGGLSHTDWRYILRPKDRRAELQDLIENHGYDQALIKIGLKKEIDALTGAPKKTDELIIT